MTFTPSTILFGGDYNPDQWDTETVREDIELMRRAKVNTATVGVFSWSKMEPSEGVYELGWLAEILDRLHAGGIGFFLATPTASPPPWFSLAHPDALPVRPDGARLSHGSRDTYAISAPAYRAASRGIARALAERFGGHPGLRGWHIHNEYGTLDYGPHAARAFRVWLRAKYGTLETLNAAWWTAFWSQGYGSWEEVLPPRATQYLHNPAQAIDFRRFCSDEMLAAYTEQCDEIRAAGSMAPATTNFMLPTWNHLEQWAWSDAQDVVSIDHYLDTRGPDGEAHVAYGGDLTRSWGDGPWLLMEQNATGISADGRWYTKSPDRTIRNSLGYIARGSQSSLFFQWRQSAGGSEQWHGGLVPHAGGSSRAFATIERLGGILESIREVVEPPADGRLSDAEVGILWHADGWWALETPQMPNDALTYSDEVRSTHRALWRSGIETDFVRPGAPIGRYRVLVVPCLYPMSEETAAWLHDYAASGGTVVVSYLSGVSDENLRIVGGGFPGRLRDLLGASSEQIDVLGPDETVDLGGGLTGTEWSEFITLHAAEALHLYENGSLAGFPAITSNTVGSGRAIYVSTKLDQASRDRFFADVAAGAGLTETAPGAVGAGVEAIRRRGRDADYLFLLHHGDETVDVAGEGVDLVTGDRIEDGFRLAAGDVAVIRLQRGATVSVSAERVRMS